MATNNKPLLIRLRPETRELLDRAALDQNRSRSNLIDELLREAFSVRYADVSSRLDQLMSRVR